MVLKQRHGYLCKKVKAWLKLNEIRSIIKMGNFNNDGLIKVRGSFFKKVAEKVFSIETFYNGYKNLLQTPNYSHSEDVSSDTKGSYKKK
jgi:hypothetical protein